MSHPLSMMAATIALGTAATTTATLQWDQTSSALKPDFDYVPYPMQLARPKTITLAERNRLLNAAAAKHRKNAKRKAAEKARRVKR